MSDLSNPVCDFVDPLRKEFDARFVTSVSRSIGYVTLPDGRKAEVNVQVEADTREWWNTEDAENEDERREEEGI